MSGLPNEGMYVTGHLPPEMRTEGVELIPPTAIVDDVDGVPTQLTRVRLERPAHIPRVPVESTTGFGHGAQNLEVGGARMVGIVEKTLQYDFPLLPGVQCRVIFQGDLTADHLEQLGDYLNVACKRLREQAERPVLIKKARAIAEVLNASPSGVVMTPRKKKKEKSDGQVP